ncbi:efflux RND transporter periplasmic adaptor subunit [Beggiatoa leptomitoformis]|uniref:Efflux RND transporter periplasmic adaptor subunit n=1 Tax=Beggiatoa leptomitoformis TaxID=288004 RepID=A0A2N9YGB9_9GAMM|nr:efflux RND transporter periplasmic adaptor subunit [Beggiatoa leptomitoformis]ALG68159.1 efflux RND transporter periplasmic adaptor subunit [Beggiatoa leptomitoformis]AUI69544.1 efflux RND transporter periplasmic adaptor subunit [Beggiatoa leptomitoformis]
MFTFKSPLLKPTVLVLAVIGVAGCDLQAEEKVTAVEEVRPVRAEQVVFNPVDETNHYAGEVKARYITDLGFRVGGKIIERKVDVGDRVKKGQLLARIDPTDYQLTVLSSRAEVNSAQADLVKAQADLKRYASLVEKGVISRNDYDAVLNKHNTAAARLKQVKASLEVQENQTVYTDLYADKEGVVMQVSAEAGEVVNAGQSVVSIARPQEKEVEISVPENQLAQLKSANNVVIALWAYPEKQWHGTIREISPSADASTRTYAVRVSILDADETIHLGMTATVALQKAGTENVALLPLSALYAQGEQASVWVVDQKSQTVKQVLVKLGNYHNNQVTVVTGLEDGQWVVTAGTHKLHAGQKVKLLTAL